MKNEYIKKNYRFTNETIDKIEKLKRAKELENPGIKIFEKDILVDAVDLAYSSKFGKEVFQETMSKLETMMSNVVHKTLLEHLAPFATAIDNVHDQVQISKEAMLLILVANKIVGSDPNIISNLVIKNSELEYLIAKAIELKSENQNE